jgi:SAM-dependent methyltransferase
MERLVSRELMDDDEEVGTTPEWRDTLLDLARINARLGGWSALRHEIESLDAQPRSVLDVATGGADMPIRLLDYLAIRKVRATCTAVDKSERIIQIAREVAGVRGDITFLVGDALHLPFPDASFDLATMNLALHHFEPEAAVAALREMARVAHRVIVNDLRRSRVAWAFAKLVFPLFTRNRFILHDGPMSVLRAYTPEELFALGQRAELASAVVRTYLGYRMTLSGAAA